MAAPHASAGAASQSAPRTAMILAAGKGTRLGRLSQHTPKPLLEIGGKPLLVQQLQNLAAAGVQRVVINLHHLGAQIRARLAQDTWPLEILFSEEPVLLETGGGITKALPLLGPAPFLVLNADIWTDYPLAQLPTTLGAGLLGHLVLTPKPAARETGDFNLVAGLVQRDSTRPYVQCGISVLHPALFAGCQVEPFSLRELWFAAAAAGRLSGELFTGRWVDIGTPEQLAVARETR